MPGTLALSVAAVSDLTIEPIAGSISPQGLDVERTPPAGSNLSEASFLETQSESRNGGGT
jgi:hypothetical protein